MPTNTDKQAIENAYRMGRRHRYKYFDYGAEKFNPFPFDERGLAYQAGEDDFALQWDGGLGGPTPACLDLSEERRMKRDAPFRL